MKPQTTFLAFALLILASASFSSALTPSQFDMGNSISAFNLPHKQNTNLEFSITSNFATSCELTTINSPNGILNIEQTDTSTGTFSFDVLASNYSSLGIYCHNIVCSDGVNTSSGSVCYDVTPTGEEMNGWKIALQIFASISTLGLMVLFLFLSGKGIQSKMAKDESGPAKFFFIGLSLIFLIAHILITNSIITMLLEN